MNGFEVCFNFVVSFHTFIISQYFKLCVWGGGGGGVCKSHTDYHKGSVLYNMKPYYVLSIFELKSISYQVYYML